MARTSRSERPGEAEFVAEYRRTFNWPRPAVTLDVVLFTLVEGELAVLLIRRGGHPYRGHLAIPGGFLDVGDGFGEQGEDLETGARRELLEETGLTTKAVPLHFFGIFGTPYRDPRMRTVTAAYLGLVAPATAARVQAGDDAAEAGFRPVAGLRRSELAFDHGAMLDQALRWLRQRLGDSAVLAPWLPARFRLAELRDLHRLVDGRSFDPALFRRRVRRLQEDGCLSKSGTRYSFPIARRRK